MPTPYRTIRYDIQVSNVNNNVRANGRARCEPKRRTGEMNGLTEALAGAAVADNTNILTAGPRGPALRYEAVSDDLCRFDRYPPYLIMKRRETSLFGAGLENPYFRVAEGVAGAGVT